MQAKELSDERADVWINPQEPLAEVKITDKYKDIATEALAHRNMPDHASELAEVPPRAGRSAAKSNLLRAKALRREHDSQKREKNVPCA